MADLTKTQNKAKFVGKTKGVFEKKVSKGKDKDFVSYVLYIKVDNKKSIAVSIDSYTLNKGPKEYKDKQGNTKEVLWCDVAMFERD